MEASVAARDGIIGSGGWLAHHAHSVVVPAPVREDTLQGRNHLVVPAVLVKSMVLGDELLTTQAMQDSAERWLWEGRPVTVWHTEKHGEWASAGLPDLAERQQIGTVRNVRYRSRDAALVGELWIDLELAGNVESGTEIVEAFRNGDIVEGSTGYWCKTAAEAGKHNGTPYRAKQLELDPDHYALLPGGIGKCSVADGCGAPRLNQDGRVVMGERLNARSSARRPIFSDTAAGAVPDSWPPSLDAFISANGWDASSWDDLTQQQKQSVVATTLLGDVQDTFAASMVFPVVDANGNLRENALRAVLGGRGSQADVSDAALASARSMATSLLNSQFDAGLEANQDGGAFELANRVEQALRDRFGGTNTWVWVRELFPTDSEVVYDVEQEGQGGDLFRAPYTVGDAGIEIGEPSPVEEVTRYQPSGNDSSGGIMSWLRDRANDIRRALGGTTDNGGCCGEDIATFLREKAADRETLYAMSNAAGLTPATIRRVAAGKIEHVPAHRLRAMARAVGAPEARFMEAAVEAGLTRSNEESTMQDNERDQVVAALANATPLDEEDLRLLSDEKLTAMRDTYLEAETNDGGEDGGEDPAANDGGEEPASDTEPSANAEPVPLDQLPPAVRAMVEERQRGTDELITALAANERCPFGEQELRTIAETQGEGALRKLQDAIRPTSYAGRGSPRRQARDGGDSKPRYNETSRQDGIFVLRGKRAQKKAASGAE